MQTRNLNQCNTTEYVSYQRARRTDAEPITQGNKLVIIGSFFLTTISRDAISDKMQLKPKPLLADRIMP